MQRHARFFAASSARSDRRFASAVEGYRSPLRSRPHLNRYFSAVDRDLWPPGLEGPEVENGRHERPFMDRLFSTDRQGGTAHFCGLLGPMQATPASRNEPRDLEPIRPGPNRDHPRRGYDSLCSGSSAAYAQERPLLSVPWRHSSTRSILSTIDTQNDLGSSAPMAKLAVSRLPAIDVFETVV